MFDFSTLKVLNKSALSASLFVSAFSICLFFVSCKEKKQVVVIEKNGYTIENTYGKDFDITNVITVNALVDQLATSDSLDIVLEANISSVCKVKGCWMNLVDSQQPVEDKSLFVKFQDYGFFVPLDSEGYRVLVKGIAFKEVTSVEELRHYAEDEGKSKEEIEKITEPAEELKITATGAYHVRL
jgi:hypothetical protein